MSITVRMMNSKPSSAACGIALAQAINPVDTSLLLLIERAGARSVLQHCDEPPKFRFGSRPRENAERMSGVAHYGVDFAETAVLSIFSYWRALGKPDAAPDGFACLRGSKKRRLRRCYAAIAAISGLMPMIFITRVRL
jgi:hypothetical protein